MARLAVAVALALAALTLGAGCGTPSARDRVADYVRAADDVQRQASPAISRANAAYRRFAAGALTPEAARRELARAEREVRATRGRLAGLAAPPDALGLRGRLLAVYDLQAGLARETTMLAVYLPAAAVAQRRLARAGRSLGRELRASRGARGQRRALARYGATLREVRASLLALRPPALMARTRRDQLHQLARTRTLVAALSGAIRRQDAKGIARVLKGFRGAGSRRPSTGLDRASARAYERRLRAVAEAVYAVRVEEGRLERRVG